MIHKYINNILFAGLLLTCLTQNSWSAGYALLEQSAEGVGTAFSGSVTGYGDGSEAFFNPAGLAHIHKTHFYLSGHIVSSQVDFNSAGSSVSGLGNVGTKGSDGGDAFVVPNLYLVRPLDDKTTIAFSLNTPFGLSTEYDDNWVGRYQAQKSELTVVNFAGSAGFQATENLSLGINIGLVYADAELSNAIDFGSIGSANLGIPTASALGLMPQSADGKVVFDGDDYNIGWGLGAMYSYGQNNSNRFGFNYRAKTDLTLDGRADFTVPSQAAVLTSSGSFSDTGISADATLPESISLGWKHWIHPTLAVMWESQWTRWTNFDELRIQYDSAQADSVTNQGWNNSWRHSVGLKYLTTPKTDLRFGLAYDLSPVADSAHRTPRIPDADRYWLAGGVGYQVNDVLKFDLNYAHLFISDESSNTVGATGDRLVGDWDSAVDIVSMSLIWSL